MYEAQQSFMNKKSELMLNEMNKLKKRRDFDNEFIKYGKKNNILL